MEASSRRCTRRATSAAAALVLAAGLALAGVPARAGTDPAPSAVLAAQLVGPVAARVAAVTAPAQAAPGQAVAEAEVLEIGRARAIALDADDPRPWSARSGRARRLTVTPRADGPLVVRVVSSGDVFVRRFDGDGVLVAADDDGGAGTNARLDVDGTTGDALRLEVGLKTGDRGVLAVDVRAAPEAGAEPSDALAEAPLHEARAELLRERGELVAAAIAWHEAGQARFAAGEHAFARRDYAAALPLAEQAGHALLTALARAHVGAVAARFGELDAARRDLELAAQLAADLGQPAIELFVASHLAFVDRAEGHRDAALRGYEHALGLARSTGDVLNASRFCAALAELALDRHDHEAARTWLAQAHEAAVQSGLDEARAEVEDAFGHYHYRRSEFSMARGCWERALELGRSPRAKAQYLVNLGTVSWRTGDLAEAREAYDTVLDQVRALGDVELEWTVLVNLGRLWGELGAQDVARATLQEALTLTSIRKPAERAKTLLELAVVLFDSEGEERTVGQMLEEAMTLAERARDTELSARVLDEVVHRHYLRGEYEKGLLRAEQALHLSGDLGAAARAAALSNVAELRLKLGRAEDAREPAHAATELQRAQGGQLLLNALATEIDVALVLGDVEGAMRLLDEAEAVVHRPALDRLDTELAAGLRARRHYAVWSEFHADLVARRLETVERDETAEGRMRRRAIVSEGFEQADAWKSRSLLEGIAEHRRGARSAAAIELRDEGRAVRADKEAVLRQVADAIAGGARASEIEALRARAATLVRRADEIAARMERIAPRDADLDVPRGVGVDTVWRDVLRERGALLEYVDGRTRTYVFVVSAGEVRFVDLGDREEIARAAGVLLDGMTESHRLAGPGEIAAAGRALFDLVLRRALPDGLGADEPVVIVPNAALAAVPFEALVIDAPAEAKRFADIVFAGDRLEITYAPSSSVLALLRAVGPRVEPGSVLALADPLYPGEGVGGPGELVATARAAPAPQSLARLPATRSEVFEIAALLREDGLLAGAPSGVDPAETLDRLRTSRSGTLRTPRLTIHLGADASPDVLHGDLREHAVIHCGAHGYVDPEDPRRSGLALAFPGGADGDDAAARPSAGAQGYLTVADVLDLDLDAELAVMSACETGRGKVLRGEGVQSLARAFLYAGARSVVASLWKVEDQAAADTMKAFYAAYLRDGESPSRALHAARRQVRSGESPAASGGVVADAGGGGGAVADAGGVGRGVTLAGGRRADQPRAHPFYWAPFIHVGLPR